MLNDSTQTERYCIPYEQIYVENVEAEKFRGWPIHYNRCGLFLCPKMNASTPAQKLQAVE